MRTRRMKKLLATTLAATAIGGALSALPAGADCVSAEVYVQRPNQTKQYVVGPKRCVVNTPFAETFDAGTQHGEPSVGYVGGRVWIPAP